MTKGQFITPAKAARGLGSAKSGTSHFIRQRVSAIALIFLVPWFLYSVLHAMSGDYDAARLWASQPWNALLLLLTAGAAAYHMRLGAQTVIEDYIEKSGTRLALLILNTFAAIALFAVVFIAILMLWTQTAAR
jgi:succinate dehydrogenase / fumarate reductase, membrane anchor subunit